MELQSLHTSIVDQIRDWPSIESEYFVKERLDRTGQLSEDVTPCC